MLERSELIASVRAELVGPSRPQEPAVADFIAKEFHDLVALRRGGLSWRPSSASGLQEVLYYERESPHRKYGAGLLHPGGGVIPTNVPVDIAAADATDPIGAEADSDDVIDQGDAEDPEDESSDSAERTEKTDDNDDFEVTSPDIRHPSTIGLSFCASLPEGSRIRIRLPENRLFAWQGDKTPFPVNGYYERCTRKWSDDAGKEREAPIWRRQSALNADTAVTVECAELLEGKVIRKTIPPKADSQVKLAVEMFPRRLAGADNTWLITAILRNTSNPATPATAREAVLYQTYFEVAIENGLFEKYPESERPFEELDEEEQSLALLYRDSATWCIGHGCAAGWDSERGHRPEILYIDVMPAVELPSMTPDIYDSAGNQLNYSMRALSELPDGGQGPEWESLDSLSREYGSWISKLRSSIPALPIELSQVANAHVTRCELCLNRINAGVALLRENKEVRNAFKLANLAMLLQQVAQKQLSRRDLIWDSTARRVRPAGMPKSPWSIYMAQAEGEPIGQWRAFQIAFLLMSLRGSAVVDDPDREVVDLIWFPTGGGKTEAYLAVLSYYLFHQRLISSSEETIRRDGTNVLMRYTLRMLTTQQFQRAASLICSMEFLRREPGSHGIASIPGQRFSLGLWIGADGSPNDIRTAKAEINSFRKGYRGGNPLVLTECPWCRAEIGRYEGNKPAVIPRLRDAEWNATRTRGIIDTVEGPLLLCSDSDCVFGGESSSEWLPVEVIDERIYEKPPSLIIGTADKFAMIAYRPRAGAIFGRRVTDGEWKSEYLPPGLLIQDELHLISGPLGTMYALYEGVIERLCSYSINDMIVSPKIIASTATIRGASSQVMSLYARSKTSLFPSPGFSMGDSFFGTYAKGADGKFQDGRLYLGVHAVDYGSVLTTQVRTFSSALFQPYNFAPEKRDAWWTLLAFYNSIRELGGAKTLFDSDIRSRLKFMFNREGFGYQDRRHIRIVEELTSRLSQAEIVGMLDRLSSPYTDSDNAATLDACLASNIIEVGVDIDRLSLMGVVGQPKTTATYIQVTGRVGRRWWDRPGLILMIYNPSKSRDRSHFEQFHSYHRRLYERVEPTTATPFALSAIQRALPGALIAWARLHGTSSVQNFGAYATDVTAAYDLLTRRCEMVQSPADQARSLAEMQRVLEELRTKWASNPQEWERFPPSVDEEYLMLWPGQFASRVQKDRGIVVPSSMRQVDSSAELTITQGYV